MGKNKRAWVHIDTVKGENSEFDSLGTVEELKDYNEDDLSNIIAETTGMPAKKRKKFKLVEEKIESNDIAIEKKADNSEVESTTKNKKKNKKRQEKENAACNSDSQKKNYIKTVDGDDSDKKKSDFKEKEKKKKLKKNKKKQKKEEDQTSTPSTKDDPNAEDDEETVEDDKYDIDKAINTVDQATDKSSKKKKKKANKIKGSNDTATDVSKSDKDVIEEDRGEVVEELDFLDIRDKWGNMGIPDEILKALLDKKFTDPTEIQKRCIPKGIGFKDVVGAAETGKMPLFVHIF